MDIKENNFWNSLQFIPRTGCRIWIGYTSDKGYGILSFNGRHQKSHRLAWKLTWGSIPKDYSVRQHCNNRSCCEPTHLYLSKNTNDSLKWEENFWGKIKIGGIQECWPWIGKSRHHWGYGLCREKWTKEKGRGRYKGAHIIVFELVRGPTNGLQVLHSCDNPSCCSPFHLFLGTQQDNIDDMMKKGRDVRRKGNEKSNAKMTPEIVEKCRSLYVPYSRQFSADALARRFGISPGNMYQIIKGNAWRHIQPPAGE